MKKEDLNCIDIIKSIIDDKINNLKIGSFKTFGNHIKDEAVKLSEILILPDYMAVTEELFTTIFNLIADNSLATEKKLSGNNE